MDRISCSTGKVGHETRGQAMTVLKRVLRSAKKRKPEGLEAYRCKRCGLWHIGNSGMKPRKAFRSH
jgi:hypothetical protein